MNTAAPIKELRFASDEQRHVRREFTFERTAETQIDAEARVIRGVAVSSEAPYRRWFGIEILDHSAESVDLERFKTGAAVLFNHNYDNHLGVITDARIGPDKKLRVDMRFGNSPLAQEKFADIADGILTKVSIGYVIRKAILEETDEEGPDTYRVTSWEGLEASWVTVPADNTVGLGRSAMEVAEATRAASPTPIQTVKNMDENQTQGAPAVTVTANNGKDAAVIMALGRKHDKLDLAQQALEAGKSLVEFKGMLADALPAATPAAPASPIIGLTDKEARSFSFLRAMNAAASGDWSKAGFELEVSRATAEATKRTSSGFLVPADVLLVSRAVTVGNSGAPGAGFAAVDNTLAVGSLIELLRNKLLATRLGVRVLGGLVGDVTIPKASAGSNGFWTTGEGESVSASTPALGSIALQNRTVGSYTDLSRKFLKQSSVDAEAWARDELLQGIATAIDLAIFHGTGADGQPRGIFNTTGINVVEMLDGSGAMAANQFGKLVDMETKVVSANADLGTFNYVFTPEYQGILKQTLKSAGVGGYVLENGQANGHGAYATNQLKKNFSKTVGEATLENLHGAVYGDFSQVLVGQWGVMDVTVDTITQATSGGVRITALQDADVAIRHPKAFTVARDIKIA